MTKAKQKVAIELMFSRIDDGLWWQPSVFVKETNPVPECPDLTPAEAVTVFALLSERGLIFPAINEHKQPCFLLHSGKKDSWKAMISESRDVGCGERIFRFVVKRGWTFLFWLVVISVGAYVVKNVEDKTDSINKEINNLRTKLNPNE